MKGACKFMEMSLLEYAYGELNDDATLQMEAHLPTCPQCQQELANIREVSALTNQVEPPIFPQALDAPILAMAQNALDTAQESPPSRKSADGVVRRLFAPAPMAVALAAAAAIVFMVVEKDPVSKKMLTDVSMERSDTPTGYAPKILEPKIDEEIPASPRGAEERPANRNPAGRLTAQKKESPRLLGGHRRAAMAARATGQASPSVSKKEKRAVNPDNLLSLAPSAPRRPAAAGLPLEADQESTADMALADRAEGAAVSRKSAMASPSASPATRPNAETTTCRPLYQQLSAAASDQTAIMTRYRLARCEERQRNLNVAINQYSRLYTQYPRHELAPECMFRAAGLMIKTGQQTRAKALLELLGANPSWRDRAREQLQQLSQ